MFGLGMTEILVILILALVVIGPKRLPEVAKALGKGYAEFRKAFSDFKSTVDLNEPSRPSSPVGRDLEEVYRSKWEQPMSEEKSQTKETVVDAEVVTDTAEKKGDKGV